MPAIDITGQTFGLFTVTALSGVSSRGERLWSCVCNCGAVEIVAGYNLRAGLKTSCGCIKRASLVKSKSCAGIGCEAPARTMAGGQPVCGRHWQRWTKYQCIELPDRKRSPDGKCTASGCDRPVRSVGASLCDTHYCRVRRGEDDPLRVLAKQCLYCSKDLTRWQTKYCSSLCHCRHNRGTPLQRTCRICDNTFPSWERATACSKKCMKALRIEKANRRRGRINGVTVEEFSTLEIFRRDKWICQLCGEKTDRRAPRRDPRSPSLDHIIPISKGGAHSRANTQCSHLICNLKKGAKEIGQLRMFG